MRCVVILFLLFASVVLTACGSGTGHAKTYVKKSQQIGSLVVPPGVPMVKQDTYYPIPVVATPTTTQITSLTPPTLLKGTDKSTHQ